MTTLEKVKLVASTSARVMIAPRVPVRVASLEDRKVVQESARRVISKHHDVLLALKNR
jgi:hypothetical protein